MSGQEEQIDVSTHNVAAPSAMSQHRIEDDSESLQLIQERSSSSIWKKPWEYLIAAVVIIIAYVAINWSHDLAPGSASAVLEQEIEEGKFIYNGTLEVNEAYVNQKINHFRPDWDADDNTWFQRVLVDNQYVKDQADPPVLLYFSISPADLTDQSYYFNKQATEIGAIRMIIETRYFGLSMPFGPDSYTLENLQYLTIEQIVEDIGTAVERIQDYEYFGVTKNSKWVINARSKSATVALWIKAKFPKLFSGAILSSPAEFQATVTEPLVEGYHIYASGGSDCVKSIESVQKEFKEEYKKGKDSAVFKQFSRHAPIDPIQMLVDIQLSVTELFNRYNLLAVCNQNAFGISASNSEPPKDMFKAEIMKIQPYYRSVAWMSKRTRWRRREEVRTARAQRYLQCTQVGMFYLRNPKRKSLGFSEVTEQVYRDICRDTFGVELWPKPSELMDSFKQYYDQLINVLVFHPYYSVTRQNQLKLKGLSRVQQIAAKCTFCEDNFDYHYYGFEMEGVQKYIDMQNKKIEKWTHSKGSSKSRDGGTGGIGGK